ncbi:MAG: tetratricopeptide repeat protein, partial [Pseudomonadota bacterium]
CTPRAKCPAMTTLDRYRTDLLKFYDEGEDQWDTCVDKFNLCEEQVKLTDEEKAGRLVCRAAGAVNRGSYDEALKMLKKASELFPDMAEAHHFVTHIYLSQEKGEKAVESAKKEVSLAPQWSWAQLDLATAYQIADDYESALEAAQEAVRLDPQSAVAHFSLASILFALNSKDALDELKTAVELAPDESSYLIEYFNAMVELNDLIDYFKKPGQVADDKYPKEEQWAADRLLELFPDEPSVLVRVAKSRARLGEYEKANKLLRKALDMNPENQDALEGLVLVCAMNQSCSSVESFAAGLEKMEPQRAAELFGILAGAIMDEGDMDGAEKYYRKTIELNPDHAGAHASLSAILITTCRLTEGLDEVKKALELSPDNAYIKGIEATALMSADRYEEAMDSADFVVTGSPKDSYGYLLKSNVHYHLGELDQAIDQAEKAIEIIPDEPGYHLLLADYLVETNKLDEAEKEVAFYCEKKPDDAACFSAMGTLQVKNGLVEEGIALLRQAVEKDPKNANLKIYLAKALTEKKKSSKKALKEAADIFMGGVKQSPELATKRWVLEVQKTIPALKKQDLGITPFDSCEK